MEAARPRTRGRRLRRGTVERPLNTRLVRVGFVVVVPAIIAMLFSISTTGILPRSSLEPLFDGENAAAIAGTLATQYPSRVPGSEGARDAAFWYQETVSSLGLSTEEDAWTQDLADLGTVELRNVVTVVPGRSDETIVVVAHRDNAGTEEALGDNASGTAALVELARGFAPQESGPAPLPNRTLVLVSTDGGSYGGAGAAHFADTSPLARSAIAVVVLDGLGGRGLPRIAIAGDKPVSPARPLVRTAAARVEEQAGVAPELPGVPTQLADLGLPFAGGEQGRFLDREIAAVTLTTSEPGDPANPAGDPGSALRVQRLGQLGRATEALLSSLDISVGVAFRTPDSLFLADRAASGWTVRLTLVLALVPFALGLVDLLVRARRRRLPFAPALRALRTRLGLMLFAGLLVWLGALTGVFPTGAALPLAPFTALLDDPPLAGLALLGFTFAMAWLALRSRLVPRAAPTSEERLAGLASALAAIGIVAFVLALTKPYALVFVLPSLYAWLWLPLEGRAWRRVSLFALGLLAPVLGLVLLGSELGISVVGAALYVVGLVTVGYLPLGSALLALAWAAGAAQVGALAFGRYGPYAGGAKPPPGPVRRVLQPSSRERGTGRALQRRARPRRAARG
jgi:Peptidase family M28